jgi:glycosyltransferase involved in cell wall biosynthesis
MLERYLRRERPDALISAMTWNNLVAIWAHGLAAVDTTLLVCEHTTLSEQVRSTSRWQIRQLPRFVRAFYSRADVVAAVSDGAAADLARTAELPRERVLTLYNPVDVERVQALAREPCEHPWLAPGEPPLILAVGRLKPEKDYPTLLRAFDRVRAKRPARLLILGEGAQRRALEARVLELGLDDVVELPGFVRNPYAYMARASAFVLSSTWEGLPTVLTEALACGCPVVSTDCRSGPRELLDGGTWGRLVEVGDATALAQALLRTLAAPPPRDELRKGAERFSIERCVAAYLRALEGASPTAAT